MNSVLKSSADDLGLTGLKRFSVLVYLSSVLVSVAFSSFEITFSLALGGAFALGNMVCLERLMLKLVELKVDPGVAGSTATLSFYIRFALMGLVFYVFIKDGWINFPALLAGLSVMVVTIPAWFLLLKPRFTPALNGNRHKAI